MKPILRWVVGDVHNAGLKTLAVSIRNMRRIYQDRFDYYLCYNNISPAFLEFNIPLINQDEYHHTNPIPLNKNDPAWKLYPPRLNLNTHEIVVDNDVILYEPLEEIETFLSVMDHNMICEGLNRNFGIYDYCHPSGVKYNTGLYGMHPSFDLESIIRRYYDREMIREWETQFDEQGFLSYCLTLDPFILIGMSQIGICTDVFRRGRCGVHLCGSNCGKGLLKELDAQGI